MVFSDCWVVYSADLLYKLAGKPGITERQILDLHKLFYLRIDAKQAGRYRRIGVVVTRSTLDFPRPAELKKVMRDFIEERLLKNLGEG
jgi:uncharacterized protein YbgA (DUF1722 family)